VKRWRWFPATALVAALASPLAAQDYPKRPLRFMIGFAPGGAPSPSTPEEMRERIEREIARWKRVVELKKIERQ
jgi:tripartite-type tricarboxylate transporter receptor subunit TctC